MLHRIHQEETILEVDIALIDVETEAQYIQLLREVIKLVEVNKAKALLINSEIDLSEYDIKYQGWLMSEFIPKVGRVGLNAICFVVDKILTPVEAPIVYDHFHVLITKDYKNGLHWLKQLK